ncbi:uncharacterized protein LOC143735775 [Siphateles boraxobius]|uniref:uncharacterized protein LOC143735775 n=1 Tax=Siphateles boraxobius TaxID=180520 RepID=UPI004063C28D
MEGDLVTLHTGIKTIQQEDIKWYFNGTLVAEITGDVSKICTDVQCKERFRDRLKLDHQTGSLTITNTRTTHSGLIKLQINSSVIKNVSITVTGFFGFSLGGVSVMEGDSVTLKTGVTTNQQNRIRWYFNGILIAEITRGQSKICTDVQCKERFRNRLKLDHQTGSLTISNSRTTDSGVYQLKIRRSSSSIIRRFSVSFASEYKFMMIL